MARYGFVQSSMCNVQGKSTRFTVLCAVCCLLCAPIAHAALTLSTDHRSIMFGRMQLGEEKILAEQGSFHNEITCASTNGQAWYLKVNVIQPLVSGAHTIPLEAFRWHVVSTNGGGTLAHPREFSAFSLVPQLIYISTPSEATGQSITFQFRYLLHLPEEQVSGAYSTTIRFTLTEML